jgi:hypothetical protein
MLRTMMTPVIGIREDWLVDAALRLADWLKLAAAPSYGFMALFTAVFGESPQDMLCMAMHHASPLSGTIGSMAWMYMLMSMFHSAPWLKLIAGRNSAF